MDDNKLLHLLDLAYMGYPYAVKALSENYGRLYDVVAEGITAKAQLDSYETALNERDSTIYDLEGEIGTLERAILTLEEELSEARSELNTAVTKTEASLSFKLWLEDMEETDEPIEWSVYGTTRDIGRMQARLNYLNTAIEAPNKD